MNIRQIVRFLLLALVFPSIPFSAAAEDFTNAIHAFLQHRVEVEKKDVGIVVGIVDERGSSIVSCGKMDNGTDQEVNGDSLFDISSITKTFTVLLLQDMVERGEMQLDDPAARYLPKSVRMPARNGKQITLVQLARDTSGLPDAPGLYDFLTRERLPGDPRPKNLYSTAGMALLGQVIALQAGNDYESMIVDRICRPLNMDSTRITLTQELKSRLATGHDQLGRAVSSVDLGGLVGGVGLRSTADDMLKYISASLGLTPSSLTPLMEKTHVAQTHEGAFFDRGLPWWITRELQGTRIVWDAGGGLGCGCSTFVGFDTTLRRGVVVMSNSRDGYGIYVTGMLLLESEWQSGRRPTEAPISSQVYDSYAGQYSLSPNFAPGMLVMRQYLLNAPKGVIYIPAGICLAILVILLWRAANLRKRCLLLGGASVAGLFLTVLSVVLLSHMVGALFHPGVEIHREGNRLFAQYTLTFNRRASPVISKLLPPFPTEFLPPYMAFELLPESETRFFNRLTGMPVTFSRDNRDKVIGLTAHLPGANLSFAKISDQTS